MTHLRIRYLNPQAFNLYASVASNWSTLKNSQDSGFDLFVPEEVKVPANAVSFKIPLGIQCEWTRTSDGHSTPYMIFPRSSMGSKTPLRLANSIGLIDRGYRGELMIVVDNRSDKPYTITVGQRLVQLVHHTYTLPSLLTVTNQPLTQTDRGEGGFGSTGV